MLLLKNSVPFKGLHYSNQCIINDKMMTEASNFIKTIINPVCACVRARARVCVCFVLGHSFKMQFLVYFLILKSSRQRRESWYFTLIVFSCYRMVVCILCLFLTVTWVDQWSVIMVFPGHTFMGESFQDYSRIQDFEADFQ